MYCLYGRFKQSSIKTHPKKSKTNSSDLYPIRFEMKKNHYPRHPANVEQGIPSIGNQRF